MALQENPKMDKTTKDAKLGIEETLAELEEDWMQYKETLEQRTKMRTSPNVSRVLLSQRMEALMSTGGGGLEKDHGKVCVLSIDGGGMMGIIPARVLAYLEETLQKKSGNPDARIADFFDIAAGTSVGGLIATMLFTSNERGRPIFSGAQTWKLVAEKGKSVFKIPSLLRPLAKLRGILTPRYSTKPLESVLKDHFLRDERSLTLKDTLKPLLVPCYDLSTAAPFLFSRADALETDDFDFHLWEICRATSSVPGLFKPARVSSVNGKTACTAIDGGLVMNNPTAAAVTHVFHNKVEFPHARSVDDLLVLSLGTGLFEQTFKYEKVRFWGAFQWAKPVVKIVLDGISEMVDHTMSMAFSEHRQNYLRIQVSGTTFSPTDINPNNASLKRLTDMAEQVLDQPCIENVPFGRKNLLPTSNRERLDLFADCLVAEHRARAARVVPTVLLKSASTSGSGSGSGSGSNSSSGN